MDKDSRFGVVADTNSAEIYLKHSHSGDIKVISVTPGTSTADGGAENPVEISVRSLTASNSVVPIAPDAFDIYSLGTSSRLLATVGNSVASITTDSDTVTTIPLSIPANQILQFDATAPNDPTVRRRAVLYQTAAAGASLQSGVTFVNLADLETSKTQALQAVDFGTSVSSVLQFPNLPNQLVVILSGGGIDVLDLETRHWSPIESIKPINVMFADTTPKRNRLWVGHSGDNRIGYVDLENSNLDDPNSSLNLTINKSTELDNPVQQIFHMYNANPLISRVIVTHDQVGGAVTLINADTPERSTAIKLEGFLLSNLL
jgi:hypothetical protein